MSTSTLSLTVSVPSVVVAVQVTVSPGERLVVDKSKVEVEPRFCDPLLQLYVVVKVSMVSISDVVAEQVRVVFVDMAEDGVTVNPLITGAVLEMTMEASVYAPEPYASAGVARKVHVCAFVFEMCYFFCEEAHHSLYFPQGLVVVANASSMGKP